MRFVHTTLAVLLSAGCALAWTADARAQSCNDFSPQWEGNWQVQLGNNSCAPLTGVTITVAVTQDIKVASSTGYDGFSMQLNANGPSSGLSPSQLYWTQFVIEVAKGSVPSGWYDGVSAFSEQWSSGQQQGGIYPYNPTYIGTPSTINDTFLTIPAGTTFKWTLGTDSGTNYVNSCQFSVTDTIGTTYTTATENIPSGDRAPIYSITMDIVGFVNSSYTYFQSGAGTITYSATSLSSSYDFPSCADNTGTGENSNMVYGPLTGSGNTRTQEFFASTVADFRNGDCEPSSTYPSGDWAPGDYKAECPLGAPVYGVSRVPGQTWSEDIECGMTGQSAYSNSGTGCYSRWAEDYDNRGDDDSGWDWDPGSYKTECNANEYVAGVSQASGNGVVTSILCCPASVTHQSCDAQVFYNGDSSGYVPPDWDSGYYKGQCPAGQYVAGISTPAYASVGIAGAAHAVLCCTQ